MGRGLQRTSPRILSDVDPLCVWRPCPHDPEPRDPGSVPSGDHQPGKPVHPEALRLGAFLSPLASFPNQVSPPAPALPDTFLSLRHSFQGPGNFFAGLDLPLRHFLEWPLGVRPHPDGIQMQTSLLSPQLWLLSWGKLILSPLHTPLPTSLAWFLGPEVKAQANTSPRFSLQSQGLWLTCYLRLSRPLFNLTGNCSVSQSKCQHDNDSDMRQWWPRPEGGRAGCVTVFRQLVVSALDLQWRA